MANTIEIKHVDNLGAQTLSEISKKTFKQTFEADNTEENMNEFLENSYNVQQLKSEMKDSNSDFYFLLLNNQPIGYSKIISNKDNFELERIYILQGNQRKGFGNLLMDHAISLAKLNHVSSINLGVWEHNENAKKFYAKQGFVKTGSHVFQLGDDPQTDFILNKKL
ncbi:GNAT family N-acetyltransferase [Companilactobacillus mishanensis]|uniref:GNAT family N-acetyltransferase n=1 Tax=Companilactobacillus mishanensis TaxID=2486008 RepID=UPI001783E8FA|nr:GNAT family N-acetyltransferase [Companilactobacillus mishanensis]